MAKTTSGNNAMTAGKTSSSNNSSSSTCNRSVRQEPQLIPNSNSAASLPERSSATDSRLSNSPTLSSATWQAVIKTELKERDSSKRGRRKPLETKDKPTSNRLKNRSRDP